jgi:hypothetical protein
MLLAAVAAATAGKKPPSPTTQGGNELVDIRATVHYEKEDVAQLLGFTPSADLIVVEVTVNPRGEEPYKLDRDDFTLITHKDGQRSAPFSPEQLAGTGALVVRTVGRGDGGMAVGDPTGGIWGGIGGRPQQMPGQGGGMGNTAEITGADSKVETGEKDKGKKANPALAALKAKILKDGPITDRVTGLLYFPIEGKQKLKDLELMYKSPLGRLDMEFR